MTCMLLGLLSIIIILYYKFPALAYKINADGAVINKLTVI